MTQQFNWTQEEMILAGDIAARLQWRPVRSTTPLVIWLSRQLRATPFHEHATENARYRSPSSVGMKINNLRAHYPGTPGKGLRRSPAEDPIVKGFLENPRNMAASAAKIRNSRGIPDPPSD